MNLPPLLTYWIALETNYTRVMSSAHHVSSVLRHCIGCIGTSADRFCLKVTHSNVQLHMINLYWSQLKPMKSKGVTSDATGRARSDVSAGGFRGWNECCHPVWPRAAGKDGNALPVEFGTINNRVLRFTKRQNNSSATSAAKRPDSQTRGTEVSGQVGNRTVECIQSFEPFSITVRRPTGKRIGHHLRFIYEYSFKS